MGLNLNQSQGQVFGPAGANHSPGLVPDPGSVANSPAHLLGDDNQFHAPVTSFASVSNDIQAFLDGGGAVLSTALIMWVHIPVAMTITAWHVLADQTGSVNVDIVRSATGGGLPTSSIVGGGNAPALSSAITAQQVPSGWTSTSLAQGDWVGFKVTSATSITKLNVTLTATRSVP